MARCHLDASALPAFALAGTLIPLDFCSSQNLISAAMAASFLDQSHERSEF
jgi:hypothetical protein